MQRGGWTKHHRKRWDKGYHRDQLLWVIMDYFIDFANWEDSEVFFPNTGVIPLKRGQHIFGTRRLAEFLGVDRQRIRTRLKKLEKIGFLTLHSTHHYTIATVVNYNIYQARDDENNPQTNQDLTRHKPTLNPDLTLPKKNKKNKKIKKKTNASPSPDSKNESVKGLPLKNGLSREEITEKAARLKADLKKAYS